MNNGYLVPKEIADSFRKSVASAIFFVPFLTLSNPPRGGVLLPDWGGIEGTEVERYNYWVSECLKLYAQYELRMQKVRQHESIWQGTEHTLRLQLSAEEALLKARAIRRTIEMHNEALLS